MSPNQGVQMTYEKGRNKTKSGRGWARSTQCSDSMTNFSSFETSSFHHQYCHYSQTPPRLKWYLLAKGLPVASRGALSVPIPKSQLPLGHPFCTYSFSPLMAIPWTICLWFLLLPTLLDSSSLEVGPCAVSLFVPFQPLPA